MGQAEGLHTGQPEASACSSRRERLFHTVSNTALTVSTKVASTRPTYDTRMTKTRYRTGLTHLLMRAAAMPAGGKTNRAILSRPNGVDTGSSMAGGQGLGGISSGNRFLKPTMISAP